MRTLVAAPRTGGLSVLGKAEPKGQHTRPVVYNCMQVEVIQDIQ